MIIKGNINYDPPYNYMVLYRHGGRKCHYENKEMCLHNRQSI